MTSYYESDFISQSKLKDLSKSPIYYKKRHIEKTIPNKKSDYLKLGSAVDCLLTTPDDFDNQFLISDDLTVKPTVKTLIDHMIKEHYDPDLTTEDDVVDCIHELALYNNIKKPTTLYKRIIDENILEKFKLYHSLQDKEVLSTYEKIQVDHFITSLLTNEFTSHLFSNDKFLYQHPIYWETEGIKCKSLLDMIDIDYKNKTITPIDLKKTSFSTRMFRREIEKWGYDIQAAFYTDAIKHWMSQSTEFNDFKLNNFRFVVENIVYPGSPLIWIMSDEYIQQGRDKYINLINQLSWHLDTDIWTYTKDEYQNEAQIVCNIDG